MSIRQSAQRSALFTQAGNDIGGMGVGGFHGVAIASYQVAFATNRGKVATEVNNKVAIATSDLEWAQSVFDFGWGESTLAERLRALEVLMGSQTEVIRAANLAPSTYKSVLSRNGDMASERIGALAQASGLSLEYLVRGHPICARDGACEEKRFDLAVRGFPMPSLPGRRSARAHVIAVMQGELERQIDQLSGAAEPGVGWQMPPNVAPAGFSLIAPLRPTPSPGGNYSTAEPSPFALDNDWLAAQGLAGDDLAYVSIVGAEGGPEFPAGSCVVINTRSTAPRPGAIFAVEAGDEVQLRRLVTRISGVVEMVHVSPDWPIEAFDKANPPLLLGTVAFSFVPHVRR